MSEHRRFLRRIKLPLFREFRESFVIGKSETLTVLSAQVSEPWHAIRSGGGRKKNNMQGQLNFIDQ